MDVIILSIESSFSYQIDVIIFPFRQPPLFLAAAIFSFLEWENFSYSILYCPCIGQSTISDYQ